MPCKVTKVTENREITEKELVLQKGISPFKALRQTSKSLNFLNLFGGSAKTFVENALEIAWSEEQADEYIADNHLEDSYEKIAERYSHESIKVQKLIAVASHLQDRFFVAYPGLRARVRRNVAFAKAHGYTRSVFGATRKLVEEFLRGSYDDKERSKLMRNLDNICANSDIQNFEASVIHPAMADSQDEMDRRGMKSRLFGMTHDSADFYVKKDELHAVVAIIRENFERPLEEFKGVPLTVDFSVSDLSKGEYYKGGSTLKAYT